MSRAYCSRCDGGRPLLCARGTYTYGPLVLAGCERRQIRFAVFGIVSALALRFAVEAWFWKVFA